MSVHYYQCDSCREAYFLTTDSRNRHQRICAAMKNFFSLESSAFHDQAATAPIDLSIRTTSQAPAATTAVTTSPRHATFAAVPSTSRAHSATSTLSHGRIKTLQQHQKKKTVGRQNIELSHSLTPTENVPAKPSKRCNTSNSSDCLEKRGRFEEVANTTSLTYELKKALSSAREYIIRNPGTFIDLKSFLDEALFLVVAALLQDELDVSTTFKYHVVLEAEYHHPEGLSEVFNFKTSSKMLSSPDELLDTLHADGSKLLREEAESQTKGSGWSLIAPISLTLRVSRFKYKQPSGSAHVVLPKKLENRKATINVENSDNKCFLYCMLIKHLPRTQTNAIMNERSFDNIDKERYNLAGIKFPVSINDVRKFEKQNVNCSVNIFECGPEGDIFPLKVVERELNDHTDLLLYKEPSGKSHYILITDFAKLIRPQITKGTNKITICKRCSTYKETRRCKPDAKSWLEDHTRLCIKYGPTQIRLPKEPNNFVKFDAYETLIQVPIVILADFEATLLPAASTNNTFQTHEANSFCTLIKSTLPNELLEEVGISLEPFLHRSQNAGNEFLLHMKDLAQRIESLYVRQVPLKPMSEEEKRRHEQTTECNLCEQSFNDTSCTKVLDHCHLSGAYRHTLCSRCNIRAQTPNFIPIYIHNFSNYDQSFVVKHLAILKGCEIKAIPSNSEKLISISIKIGKLWLRFLDSYRLMADSLGRLAENLSPSELIESSKLVPAEHLKLIRRKGVYPYDYITSSEKFSEESLPPKEAFYNRLNDEHISAKDYEHAMEVWRVLGMKTLGEYHDFYLRLDTCLLADVFTSFRKKCIDTYRIDCAHEYTAPGLAFRSMLLITKINLELITDADQLLMFETAMRGGLVQCNLKYFKSNNPQLEQATDYRADEPTSYLLHYDCINLYGHIMANYPLPTGDFRWVELENMPDWTNLPADSPYGIIMECDVEYPKSVHDYLQDLPPLAESRIPPGAKNSNTKLLATLINKKKYVAHYMVLQQAIRLGLKVTKIYRALRFSQSQWMAKFINLNATLRAQSNNEFSRAFHKLMNNAVFGKTMESVRNRVDIRFVTTESAFQKLVRQPKFKEHKIISENVVLVQMRRNCILMNKPIYVGMTVLDLSKYHMYNFHYSVLKEHFKAPDCELELAYLDTDGGFWALKTERNIIDIMKQPSFAKWMDGSVYPTDHPLRTNFNKGKIGTFKDETKGRTLFEYVGLRPKMYAFRFASHDINPIAKAKGIKSAYVAKSLTFDKYKEALSNKTVDKAEYNLIRCKTFDITTRSITKKSLSSEDNKRKVMSCGIKTLPYGHYRLETITEEDSENEST